MKMRESQIQFPNVHKGNGTIAQLSGKHHTHAHTHTSPKTADAISRDLQARSISPSFVFLTRAILQKWQRTAVYHRDPGAFRSRKLLIPVLSRPDTAEPRRQQQHSTAPRRRAVSLVPRKRRSLCAARKPFPSLRHSLPIPSSIRKFNSHREIGLATLRKTMRPRGGTFSLRRILDCQSRGATLTLTGSVVARNAKQPGER